MKRLHNIFKQARGVRLCDEDRVLLRKKLQEVMASHPLEHANDSLESTSVFERFTNSVHSLLLFGKKISTPVGIGLLLAVFTGVSISSATEQSLPGELLYPVKIRVIEELRSGFTTSPEERAMWEAQRLNRRLVEAGILTKRNALTTDMRVELESNIHAQSLKIREITKDLILKGKAQSAAEVSTKSELPLRVHAVRLFELSRTKKASERAHIEDLKELVTFESEAMAKVRIDAEDLEKENLKNQGHMKEAAQGKLIASMNVISSVESYVEKKNNNVAAQDAQRVVMQLEFLKKLQTEGKTKFTNGEYEQAFADFSQALHVAQEAKVYLDTEKELGPQPSETPGEIKTEKEDKDLKNAKEDTKKEEKEIKVEMKEEKKELSEDSDKQKGQKDKTGEILELKGNELVNLKKEDDQPKGEKRLKIKKD